MIKIEEIPRIEKRNHYFCDVCGQEITMHRPDYCELCGKHLCRKCVEHEDDFGDHPDTWCKKCWDIGAIYRAEIESLENKIEEVRKMWEARCKQ